MSKVHSVSFSPDGKYILSASEDDRVIKLWDVKAGKEIRTFVNYPEYLNSVCFSPELIKITINVKDSKYNLYRYNIYINDVPDNIRWC